MLECGAGTPVNRKMNNTVLRRKAIGAALGAVDTISLPLTVMSAVWLKFIRRADVSRMVLSRAALRRVGIFPIREHYYEPFVRPSYLRRPLQEDRSLPGLDMNVDGQLEMLRQFAYRDELARFPLDPAAQSKGRHFYYHNHAYGPGDAECLYSMLRLLRPGRIIEVGSGFSTLMSREAILANKKECPAYRCEMTCIEPYEQPWLETLDVKVVRQAVERVNPALFSELSANDVLFIDSSHMIRTQGDVLYLYQEVLPSLPPGVFVHVHDIFTPKDYPYEWLFDQGRMWNEQYLLEMFLALNRDFRVTIAMNYLAHHHREELGRVFPVLATEPAAYEPGAFWMQRV